MLHSTGHSKGCDYTQLKDALSQRAAVRDTEIKQAVAMSSTTGVSGSQ